MKQITSIIWNGSVGSYKEINRGNQISIMATENMIWKGDSNTSLRSLYFDVTPNFDCTSEDHVDALVDENGIMYGLPLWLSSTLKKRKAKMNKHKLRKRRKKERLKSK